MKSPRLSKRPDPPGDKYLQTRPPMERMYRIFKILKEGGVPNRGRLAMEIEVTTKTVQRDVNFMRDRLGIPIKYDSARGGYIFTAEVDQFPMVELSETELVSVYVAQKAMAQSKGTPFEAPLRSAFHKLSASMEGSLTVSWEDLDSLVSFRSFELVPMDLKVYQAVAEAVRGKYELVFEYRKLNAQGYEKRRVRPYHLACVHDQWYLIGYCLKRHALRSFVLVRMRNLEVTSQKFERPKRFSIQAHLKNSFGIFRGEGDYHVRLRFDPFAACLVRERQWAGNQTIQEEADGGLEMSLQLSSFEEIEPWILSWGEHVEVRAPHHLKNRIRRRLVAALKKSGG
ncbi:MAG: WYL domain-containing protein [Terrimicrobiaceae bacterium]